MKVFVANNFSKLIRLLWKGRRSEKRCGWYSLKILKDNQLDNKVQGRKIDWYFEYNAVENGYHNIISVPISHLLQVEV